MTAKGAVVLQLASSYIRKSIRLILCFCSI